MDSERWDRIQSLFERALACPEPERQAFVDTESGGDRSLLAEITAMLKADQRRTSLLDDGLPQIAYEMVGSPVDNISLREFGPYRLRKLLGEGGMGVVWLAERTDAGNLVAIKFLPHAGLSPARRERFAREIITLAKLQHPYIARLYDAGTLADGTPWFVMEYVDGLRLTDYCRQEERPVEDRLRLFRAVCEAVQYAHSQEIIHRDLKPSNILVQRDGTPRLLDFGIARQLHAAEGMADQTRAGLRFMSPDYSPPEWISEGKVGFYTDVYSLGVILHEMLTGQLPAAQPKTPAASLHGDLDVLCRKAMHPSPGNRYQSAEALIRDVDHFLKREPLEARPDSLRYRARKFVSRNRAAVAATAAALLVMTGLAAFFTFRLARERDYANRQAAITTAMNRFLSDDLLGRADPFQSGAAKELFVDVVNRALPQVDEQFRAEPVTAAQLHQTIARAFDNRSQFAQARREYDRAYELFLRGEGPLSEDAIEVRLRETALVARSNERGSLPAAKSLLKEAEESLSRISRPRADLSVWLPYARGYVAMAESNARVADVQFSDALRRAEALPSFDGRAPRRIKLLVAVSYIHMAQGAKAEPILREIIAADTRLSGADHPPVLLTRAYLAQSLLTQGKFSAAIQEVNAIYPELLNRLGPDHETITTVLGTRAAAEGSLGLWDDAARDDLAMHEISARTRPDSFFAIASLSDGALSQCRAEHYPEGGANARKAFDQSTRVFGPHSAAAGGCAYALSVCLVGSNKLNEASELLRGIDIDAVTQLSGDSTVAASIKLLDAEIAARRGDYALARKYLEEAAPTIEAPNAGAGEKQALARVRRSLDTQPVAAAMKRVVTAGHH
jgi:serine/threonine-protein kinase